MNIEGKDVVAIAALAVCGALIYCDHNGGIITLLSTIIGWYFGSKRSDTKKEK